MQKNQNKELAMSQPSIKVNSVPTIGEGSAEAGKEVFVAELFESFRAGGFTGTSLSASKCSGIKMNMTDKGLLVVFKGKTCLVPYSNIKQLFFDAQ